VPVRKPGEKSAGQAGDGLPALPPWITREIPAADELIDIPGNVVRVQPPSAEWKLRDEIRRDDVRRIEV